MALDSDQLELLDAVVRRRAPEHLDLISSLGLVPLSTEARETLRGVLADELVEVGLDSEDEATAYGVRLDAVIGQLMFS